MKRIIALLICVLMLFSFIACNVPIELPGQSGENGGQNPSSSEGASSGGTDAEGNAETVTVEFFVNGGNIISGNATVKLEKGSTLSYADTPEVEKDGCFFKGWSYDKYGMSMWLPDDSIPVDTVLFANWTSGETTDSSKPDDTTDSSDVTTDSSKPDDTTDSSDVTTNSSKPDDTTDSSDVTTDSSKPDDTTDSSDVTTDSSKPDDTTDSSTPDSGSAEDKPSKPTLVPDRTQYNPTVVGDKEAIYYTNKIVRHPVLTPYYNGYKSALTMTFDDGYDSNTGVVVSDTFERFGYRGTMMLGPCFLDDALVEEWNKIFARGVLDVGCHGYNHEEPTTLPSSKYEHEIKDAIEFLRTKFPGQRVLTFATPYAHINDPYEEYLSQFVIGNRLEAGGTSVNLSTNLNYNPFRVKAVSVNANAGVNNAKTEIEYGVKDGKWIVELYHCVKDQATGVDMERSAFISHCEWLYRNYRDLIWVTTFESVLIYGEQLKHTSIDYTACDRESMTVTLTPDGTLDKEIYNIPMTVQVYLPDFVDSAYAMIDGEYIPLEIEFVFETAEKYVTVRDIDATEKTDVVVYIGGNKTMKNNCVHRYAEVETVEPTHETGGYTLNECSKCGHTYYSAFTNPVHDYTGDIEIVIEPQRTLKGCAKHYCTQCEKYVVKDLLYTAPEAE